MTSYPNPTLPSAFSKRRGFALVIPLAMMAFILLLLLALTTLVRVESVSSEQRSELLQARQNALLALQLAVGELQLSVGPDQRVTATGGLWNNPATGTENLVGVWSSEDANNDGIADGDFKGWLVSSADPTATEATDFVESPMPVEADGSGFKSSNDNDYALLVGGGSVETNPADPSAIPAVVAEMKPIRGREEILEGQYAWWVGDEGTKARADLLDPFAFNIDEDAGSGPWSNETLQQQASAQSMQSSGLTALDGFSSLPLATDPDAAAELVRIYSIDELELLDFTPPSGSGEKEDQPKRYFHDLTSYSLGLQTNVRNGGLKRDLSLLFEQPDSIYDNSGSDFMQALDGEGLIYTGAPGPKPTLPLIFNGLNRGSLVYGPSFDMLRDYYRLYKSVDGSPVDPVLPKESVQTFQPGKAWFRGQGFSEPESWVRSLGQLAWRNFGPKEAIENSKQFTRNNTNVFGPNGSVKTNPIDVVRPTQGAYLPLLSRATVLYSTVAIPNTDGSGGLDLDIVIQPFIAMHNPYNVRVSAPRMRFLEKIDTFNIVVRRGPAPILPPATESDGWNAEHVFRSGSANPAELRDNLGNFVGYDPTRVGGNNSKFFGNTYADPSGRRPRPLMNSVAMDQSGQPKAFNRYGSELVYELPETEYAPGEVVLFVANEVEPNFRDRTVELSRIGLGYDPKNGIYMNLPSVDFWVDHDGWTYDGLGLGADGGATPRRQLLRGIQPGADVMLHIVRDDFTSMGYEVFNEELDDWDTAGSYQHATPQIHTTQEMLDEGSQIMGRTLFFLRDQSSADYDRYLEFIENYSASPIPHLVADHFLKPLDYNEFTDGSEASRMAPAERTFPNFILSNPLAASFSHTSTANREGNGLGNTFHSSAYRPSTDAQVFNLIQDLYDNDRASWGTNNGRAGQKNAVILEIPTAPLQSLGQLQHVSLNPMPHHPALSIGQSFRSPYMSDASSLIDEYSFAEKTEFARNFQGNPLFPNHSFVFYDQNFLINEALWDGYFFSSIAPQPIHDSYTDADEDPFGSDVIPAVVSDFIAGKRALGNSRMSLLPSDADPAAIQSDLLDPLTSARHLGVKGAFNVNSTSVEAWRVFLAGFRDVAIQYFDASSSAYREDDDLGESAFSRHSLPSGASAGTSIPLANAWSGFLRLSDEEIEDLAQAIVSEIRTRATARGNKPALGLADFINRIPAISEHSDLGTLQAAIDAAGINDSRKSAETEFSTATYNANSTKFHRYRDSSFSLNTAHVAPLSLNQGDILQAVGAAVSARSDTFKIRAYGESIGAVGNKAQAWCEAVYQRGTELTDPADENDPFGRRFKLVTFRWLSPDEV